MILLDNIPKLSKLTRASTKKRCLNFIIDSSLLVVVIAILTCLSYFVLGIPFLMLGFKWLMISSILGYAFYYWIIEISFNGKTFGKHITKTRVVTHTGERPDFVDYFTRSVCRLIPFEFVSFLISDSIGWHDRFSKTMVVEDHEVF